jgi:hypothetical protein
MLKYHRVLEPEELQCYRPEMEHLLAKSHLTWNNQRLMQQEINLQMQFLADGIKSAQFALFTLLSDGAHWVGFVLGYANLETKMFEVFGWYVREEFLDGGFDLLFDALQEYCRRAKLRGLQMTAQVLPVHNPRYRIFVERFCPTALLAADFTTKNIREAEEILKNDADTTTDRDADGVGAAVPESEL